MADSQRRFAALPLGQRVTIIIFLLIASLVVWELIGRFQGNSSSSISSALAASTPSPPTVVVPSKPPMTQSSPALPPPGVPKPGATTVLPSIFSHKPAAHSSPDQAQPEEEKTLPQTAFLVQQEQIQSKYVAAINELQMLKIQKEIAETSQAIVAANLATQTAEKSIKGLLSEASSSKGGPMETAATSTNVGPSSPPPLLSPLTESAGGGYSVRSVTMEQDQWHAVVKFKDKLYDVSVGDMLPPDKSLVKSIDQRGVTLDTAGMEQRIPLTVTDNVASPPASNSSTMLPNSSTMMPAGTPES